LFLSLPLNNRMLHTPYMTLRNEQNILFCTYADNLVIDLEVARHCVNNRLRFSKGVSYPLLVSLKGVRSVNKEARDYLAEEGSRLIKAGALIISSPLTRILGNIFLSINKPSSPARLFTDEAEAITWLKKYA